MRFLEILLCLGLLVVAVTIGSTASEDTKGYTSIDVGEERDIDFPAGRTEVTLTLG
ncbi:MAG: hypothetical protein HYX78_03865 [Armatimonadetes bacterium]|nr:hypothetical protein [Armatimonadota bacterium]